MSVRGNRKSYDVMFYLPSITPLLGRVSGRQAGGAETQIMLLSRALARRGVKVCVVAFPAEEELPAAIDGVDIVVRPVYKAHQRLVGKLREVARIRRTIASARSRVVVARVAGPQVGLAALSAKSLGRRFVYSSANIFDFDFEALGLRRRDQALYRLGLRLADEIVVQTSEQVLLCQERVGRTPVLARSVAEPAPPRGAPEALLWIGRLVGYKHPLEFVELARALPEIRFRMIGVPTPESGSLAEEVARAAATVPNLEFLGPRPRAEAVDLIGRAAAIVSTSDYEGMPNVFLEAWARGIPALTLSHDPDDTIAKNGLGEVAGGSRHELVAAARRLWEDRFDGAATSERCRSYVAKAHSADSVAAQWDRALGLTAPDLATTFFSEAHGC
jgi:glycosyltransferase involved in cell wall biosynthesis